MADKTRKLVIQDYDSNSCYVVPIAFDNGFHVAYDGAYVAITDYLRSSVEIFECKNSVKKIHQFYLLPHVYLNYFRYPYLVYFYLLDFHHHYGRLDVRQCTGVLDPNLFGYCEPYRDDTLPFEGEKAVKTNEHLQFVFIDVDILIKTNFYRYEIYDVSNQVVFFYDGPPKKAIFDPLTQRLISYVNIPPAMRNVPFDWRHWSAQYFDERYIVFTTCFSPYTNQFMLWDLRRHTQHVVRYLVDVSFGRHLYITIKNGFLYAVDFPTMDTRDIANLAPQDINALLVDVLRVPLDNIPEQLILTSKASRTSLGKLVFGGGSDDPLFEELFSDCDVDESLLLFALSMSCGIAPIRRMDFSVANSSDTPTHYYAVFSSRLRVPYYWRPMAFFPVKFWKV